MANDTIRSIMERRSIRNFTTQPLAPDELDILRDAALASPSAVNGQPWQFHFITRQSVIEKINQAALDHFRITGNQAVLDRMSARHPSIFYGAPLLVIITLPRGRGLLDAGIAAENLAIAAQSLGLGSCIIGLAEAAFASDEASTVAELIKLPAGYEFAISVAIGHAASTKEAHETHPEKITWIC
jgi:nitroreductase